MAEGGDAGALFSVGPTQALFRSLLGGPGELSPDTHISSTAPAEGASTTLVACP
jgi:hypothetical protein